MKKIAVSLFFFLIAITTESFSQKSVKPEKTIEVQADIIKISDLPQVTSFDKVLTQKNHEQGGFSSESEEFENDNDIQLNVKQTQPKVNFDEQNLNFALSLLRTWEGPQSFGWGPPDADVALGPNSAVAVVNEHIQVYSRPQFNVVATVTLQSFFGNLNSDNIFDPKIIYDVWSDRYVLLALFGANSVPSYYYLACSQTGNPAGNWYRYKWPAHIDGSTTTSFWADFPGLGLTGTNGSTNGVIAVSSNQYSVNGPFAYAKIRVFNKSPFYAGGTISGYDYTNFLDEDNSKAFTAKPTTNLFSNGEIYFVNTKAGGGNVVTLRRIDNPLGGSNLIRVSTSGIGSYSPAPRSPMFNGGTLDPGDCRTQDLILSNGKIITAFTTKYNWGSGDRAALQYIQLDLSGNVIKNQIFGHSDYWYMHPKVAFKYAPPYGTNEVVFSFCFGGANIYPQARVVAFDGSNFSGSKIVMAGYGNLGQADNRYGDYSGICMDPFQNGYFVSIAEITSPSSWSTGMSYFGYQEVSVKTVSDKLPDKFNLYQNYPNPFNPNTNIKFDIQNSSYVKIAIYDILGKEIELLVEQKLQSGVYEIKWDASNYSNGIYYCRMQIEDFTKTIKMVLDK